MDDTIFALSSGAPPAAIAIIRISGSQAEAALRALIGQANVPPERRAGLRRLCDATGNLLDEALVLRFAAETSVTGEALVELHCHGGRAVVDAVQTALAAIEGIRPALPGEFTRRAFQNGRVDLNAVEGLADLLRAETQAQHRAALAMYGGAFRSKVEAFQTMALQAAAMIEAALDFEDEDDVGSESALIGRCQGLLAALAADLSRELAAPPAERVRDGIRLVIAGPVNSGKSTLFNRLAGWDAAIVTDIAGTTRDRLEVSVAIDGTAFLLTDTAGIRDETEDIVEQLGIARAQEAIASADILLWLGEPRECPRQDGIKIKSRIDMPGMEITSRHDLGISAVTGMGLDQLYITIAKWSERLLKREADYILSRRQRHWLGQAEEALRRATSKRNPLIIGEEVRGVLAAFDNLTGKSDTEDMLDQLFSGFCIGK